MTKELQTIKFMIGGTVSSIKVQIGDRVDRGDLVVLLNSDDLEIPLVSPCNGIVHSIEVEENEVVKSNTPLVIIETEK